MRTLGRAGQCHKYVPFRFRLMLPGYPVVARCEKRVRIELPHVDICR